MKYWIVGFPFLMYLATLSAYSSCPEVDIGDLFM